MSTPDAELTYEQARQQLAEVVTKLESGGVPLAESMQLWERGEQLAKICQAWLDGCRNRLERAIDQRLADERIGLSHALSSVRAMSPKATLERGYAVVADAEGGSVTSVNDADPGDQLLLYLSDGQLVVEVDYQEEDQ